MDALKELFSRPELIWFLVGIVLLVLEFELPGLIVFFFGVGAIIVAILCLIFELSIDMQLIIFIVASLACLIVLRKWLKGIFYGHVKAKQNIKEAMSDFVGEQAVVKEKITAGPGGKVELHGTNWSAEADEEIEVGEIVEIVGKENLTLKVKKI